MLAHGLNADSAYVAHGLNYGTSEQQVQPQPSRLRGAQLLPAVGLTVFGTPGSAAPSGFGGGGAGGYFTTAPVSLRPKRRRPRLFGKGGIAGTPLPSESDDSYTDSSLNMSAWKAARLARDDDMQQWISATLSRASKKRDLRKDTAVADAVAEPIRISGASPIVKVEQAAASFTALGFPTYLVGHGETKAALDRVLTAVWLDGRWHYVDLSGPYELGAHAAFVLEKFYLVPDLPDPRPSAAQKELDRVRQRLAQAEQTISELLQRLRTAQQERTAQRQRIALLEQQQREQVALAAMANDREAARWRQTAVLVGVAVITTLVLVGALVEQRQRDVDSDT